MATSVVCAWMSTSCSTVSSPSGAHDSSKEGGVWLYSVHVLFLRLSRVVWGGVECGRSWYICTYTQVSVFDVVLLT